jgi:predicted dehydrogenase
MNDRGPLRIGVVGAGAWSALAHVPAVLANPHAEIGGIADRDPARLAATADHYGIPAADRYADHRELIAAGNLDALVIATPHATHYAIASDALDAGLHLLVEKPFTVRSADAHDLATRARAANLHIVVGYTAQFTPGAIAAHELVRAGELGEVTLLSTVFASSIEDYALGGPGADVDYTRASPIGAPSASTYSDPALTGGGGQGLAQATHALGMQLWVTGLRPRRVTALMANRRAAVDLIDAIAYELDNGALGTLAATGALGQKEAMHQELRYFGTGGTLTQDFLSGAVVFHPSDGGPARDLMPALSEEEATIMSAAVDCLIDLVRGASDVNRAPVEAATAAVELLEAAYRSAAQGGEPVLVGQG